MLRFYNFYIKYNEKLINKLIWVLDIMYIVINIFNLLKKL